MSWRTRDRFTHLRGLIRAEKRRTRKRNKLAADRAEAASRLRLVEAERDCEGVPSGEPEDELMELERERLERWRLVQRDELFAKDLLPTLVRYAAVFAEGEGVRGNEAKGLLVLAVWERWPRAEMDSLYGFVGLLDDDGENHGTPMATDRWEDWPCVREFYWRFGCTFDFSDVILRRNYEGED